MAWEASMTRIAVYRYDDHGRREPDGWFTLESAEAMVEANPMTAARYAAARRRGPVRSVIETLYRTNGGRWVLKTAWHVGPQGEWVDDEAAIGPWHPEPRYEFITDIDALDWLNRNGYADMVERFLGDTPDEQGPGRPEIGGRIQVRLGDLLGRVDAYAQERGCSRAEAVRNLVAAGLASKA
jgi:hypothetical protein